MNSSSINRDVDIVCFSLSRWDAAISSPAVSLAKEFSKINRVFYIGHPYTLKDVITGNVNKSTPQNAGVHGVEVAKPPVTLPINFLPEGKLYRLTHAINNRLLINTLREVLAKHHIDNYIFINFFDPYYFGEIPQEIRPLRYVYQCMDDMSEVAYTRRHGVILENQIISRADLVLCTSMELTRIKSFYSPRVHFHPNAADFDLFHRAITEKFRVPADMNFTGKKIIGFMGSIEYRTDFELLRKIAVAHADKMLVLVGPVSGDEHIRSGLTAFKNVVFTGAKAIYELPAYLQHFNCCIIPYKKNKLTSSIYPLKINEYLAAGKPVVATNFSQDIESFSEVSYIVGDHAQFIAAIERALDSDSEEKQKARTAIAARNTWQKRVEQFWSLLT